MDHTELILKSTNMNLSSVLTLYSLFFKDFSFHPQRINIFFNCHCTIMMIGQNKDFFITHEVVFKLACAKITPKLKRMFPIHATAFISSPAMTAVIVLCTRF